MVQGSRPIETPGLGSPEAEAFVVQIDPGPEGEALRGRVEHLASGAEARFGCAEDLLAFIRDSTRAIRKGGDHQ